LLGVQAVDQTADSRPHRRGEIRHGELDHAANLAAAFAGKRGRQQRQASVLVDIPQSIEDEADIALAPKASAS
jgi:hypothetical protein